MHNYKFPIITKSVKPIKKGFINIYCIDSKNKFYLDPPQGNILSLKSVKADLKKPNFSKIVNTENVLFAIIKPTDKDVEQNIVNLVNDLSKLSNNIQLNIGSLKINGKMLSSLLTISLRHDWNLKTTNTNFVQKSVNIVSDQVVDISNGQVLGKVQTFVQELVNMPSNMLTPEKYARRVKDFIIKNGLSSKVKFKAHNESFMKLHQMGALLGVAKGSVEKPVLLELSYKPNSSKPLVLVGKGITFDSGGISIKPSNGMDAMKGDMAGSAAAIGATLYAALTDSKTPVISLAPCCENMPSSNALKPGDVVTASNGLTIEVLDTDAEGRLVLADALVYSQKFKAKYTIDIATLTGACVVALGNVHSGMFTTSKKLKKLLETASLTSNDKIWHLPMVEDHEEMLNSKIADISNLCLGKGAGASNGAIFLKRFAPKKNWCHLDIAGTGTPKGVLASGRPLPLLSDFIDNLN